jgi:predicted peroxiredoxin
MKYLFIVFGVTMLMTGCNQQSAEDKELQGNIAAAEVVAADANELIINLTSDATADPHPSLMAINFATKAVESGLDVMVFMNVHGVKLASKDAANIAFNDQNLHEKIAAFIDKGGKVLACPMCMEIHGVDADNLVPGIEISGAGIMMKKLQENPTVFTY